MWPPRAESRHFNRGGGCGLGVGDGVDGGGWVGNGVDGGGWVGGWVLGMGWTVGDGLGMGWTEGDMGVGVEGLHILKCTKCEVHPSDGFLHSCSEPYGARIVPTSNLNLVG